MSTSSVVKSSKQDIRNRIQQDMGNKLNLCSSSSSNKSNNNGKFPNYQFMVTGTEWELNIEPISDNFCPEMLSATNCFIDDPTADPEVLDRRIKVALTQVEAIIRKYHAQALLVKGAMNKSNLDYNKISEL